MAINQGDIYWLRLEGPGGPEPAIAHPCVVVQDNPDYGRVDTVVVCVLTSNIKRISMPGNVLLEAGEANLPRQSVVEVAKVYTVEKARLGAYIGRLSDGRTEQIRAGMRFVARAFLLPKGIKNS